MVRRVGLKGMCGDKKKKRRNEGDIAVVSYKHAILQEPMEMERHDSYLIDPF